MQAEVALVRGGVLFAVFVDTQATTVPQQFTKKVTACLPPRDGATLLWLSIAELHYAGSYLRWDITFESDDVQAFFEREVKRPCIRRVLLAYAFLTAKGMALRHAQSTYGVTFIAYSNVEQGHGECLVDVIERVAQEPQYAALRLARSVGKKLLYVVVNIETETCEIVPSTH